MAQESVTEQVMQLPPGAAAAAVTHAAGCLLCLRKNGNAIALDTSQPKNLLEAAVACGDTRSLETWVLYQMARIKDWRTAGQPRGPMFGHAVTATFARPGSPLRLQLPEADRGDESPVLMKLIRLFAGELSRLHRYVKAMADEDSKAAETAWDNVKALAGEDKRR